MPLAPITTAATTTRCGSYHNINDGFFFIWKNQFGKINSERNKEKDF